MNKKQYFVLLQKKRLENYIPIYEKIEKEFLFLHPKYSEIIYGRASLFITYGNTDFSYICDFRHLKTRITMYFNNQFKNIFINKFSNSIELNIGEGINEGLCYFSIDNSTDINKVVSFMNDIYQFYNTNKNEKSS